MSVVHIVIPDNYDVTHLQGSPQCQNFGLSIESLYRNIEDTGYKSVLVASNDVQTCKVVESFGGRVTPITNHESGVDSLAEVCRRFKWDDSDIVVSLDDKVLIQPEWIGLLIQAIRKNPEVEIATLACPVRGINFDPEEVKVITDREGFVLLFSRAPIPFDRNGNAANNKVVTCPSTLRHLNFYAARVKVLKDLSNTPVNPLERLEHCDLLRALSSSYRIQVTQVDESKD